MTTPGKPSSPRGSAVASPLFSKAELGETRSKILEAAFRRLSTEGYGALSVREIAKDAGVNHALINYYFRTKDQLVIEVLDVANRRLLARQASMYQGPASFAMKWAEARRFYESDLASGFVRVQAELWGASLSNPDLREKFLPRLLAWKKVVLGVVQEVLDALEAQGNPLPPPITAEVVACWISEFWLGMEFADLLQVEEEQIAHRKALDAVQWLLETIERRSTTEPTEMRSNDSRKRSKARATPGSKKRSAVKPAKRSTKGSAAHPGPGSAPTGRK